MSRDLEGISELLRDYFDALYYCDVARIEKVFHPRAIYATADETPLLFRTKEEYKFVLAKREAPASRGEPRQDFIDAIELAGENTAMARVRCSIGTRNFVDFLSLVREGNEWRIIAKVFQIVERAT